MEFSLLNQVLVLLINAVGFYLAFWVYLADRRITTNQIFSLMTISILLWINFAYCSSLPSQVHQALFWIRLNFGAVSIFFIAAYFFSLYFPQKGKRYPILDKFVILVGITLLSFSIFTDLVIKNIEIKEWGNDIMMGNAGDIFYITVTSLTFLILFNLFKKYSILPKEEKLKVQYLLTGVSIFALMNIIFNVIFPAWKGTYEFYHLGDYSAIFFLGFTAYAIVKRELFGIKVVLTSLLVGLIAILLALDLFVFTEKSWIQILKGFVLLLFLVFGYYLIQSVLLEVKRRKELEELSSQLATANVRLDAAVKELKKLDKAKSEFISMASHQLRTPLSAIKGYISMMMEGSYGKLPDKAGEKLKNVFQSTERLTRIVNDLLNISKIELGKMELDKQPIQIEDLIQSCYEEMKIEVEKRGLKFSFSRPEIPLPKIKIDPLKIRQVILNLIDNAVRYTQKGEIEIRVKKIDSALQILFKDTGEGLTREEERDIFAPFTRGSAGLNLFIEGAGLGLYVGKKYIELHGGKIWAKSSGEGKGSTFYIELPIE